MFRGLFLTLVYTQNIGIIQLRGKQSVSFLGQSTLGKSTMCFSQENNRIWILAPLPSILLGVWAFSLLRRPVSPLMFLVPDLDLSQQKDCLGPEKILFPSEGGSICFFLKPLVRLGWAGEGKEEPWVEFTLLDTSLFFHCAHKLLL